MHVNTLITFFLASLSAGQDVIANGAEALLDSPAPDLEKRRIIGWTTRWVTYYPTHTQDDGCHDHHHPCETETVFVVPSTITEVSRQTIFTYQTIPVPIPVPPCPCNVPDCRRNGCNSCSPHGCECTRANPCDRCHGGGGNSIISTSTIPYTTPAPASSVIVLSTKTNSFTIYTQSAPASNGAHAISKANFYKFMLSLMTAFAVMFV